MYRICNPTRWWFLSFVIALPGTGASADDVFTLSDYDAEIASLLAIIESAPVDENASEEVWNAITHLGHRRARNGARTLIPWIGIMPNRPQVLTIGERIDRHYAYPAAVALSRIGTPAVPPLTTIIRSHESTSIDRQNAAWVLLAMEGPMDDEESLDHNRAIALLRLERLLVPPLRPTLPNDVAAIEEAIHYVEGYQLPSEFAYGPMFISRDVPAANYMTAYAEQIVVMSPPEVDWDQFIELSLVDGCRSRFLFQVVFQ